MTQATVGLTDLFELEEHGDDVWLGHSDGVPLPQLFGGQLVGQSVMAAGLSNPPGSLVHSVHTTFLRGGRSGEPVELRVDRLRDGRLFTIREVSAWQGDRLVCRSTISSAQDIDGIAHSRPHPGALPPEDSVDLQVLAEADGGLGEFWENFSAIEIRVAPDDDPQSPHSASPARNIWMRAVETLPDDPIIHRAAIAYASDLMLMSSAVEPHGHRVGQENTLGRLWNAVSLDHTLWFAGPARADEWLLYEHTTPMAYGARALINATVFDTGGTAVGMVAQEALVRPNA
ncbi:putative acyl-CoA thioesterase II [Aeromicrobium marinum DSM 15272]|uniref:Acyl-CoA thioesterase II n=1 Tax=Aeromicrobium marinum DSM 15272 TaxID=585531 RepID=E2S7X6_9ACTN|nr:acyl-CoA thioesterase domain-containing protein [Aeromicrobium marinum]EFQ84792.1 putative acyl-CoA thioesterase II [Aeromicrobium marinum DSM 15272]